MSRTLRLKISGLGDVGRVEALKRSLGLVADVQGVVVDPERGEVLVNGDPDEHLVVVHLANEGFEAHSVHEPAQHPQAGQPVSARSIGSENHPTDVNRIRSVSSNTEGEVKDATGSPAENTKGRIGGKVEQVAGQVRGAHPSSKRATREGPSIMGAELNDFMAARPVTALFIAVGVGYMLARLMRR